MKLQKIKVHKVIVAILVILFIGYYLSGADFHMVSTGKSLESPSWNHLLGTDDLGIDILAQLCYGGGQSLLIGGLSGAISVLISMVIGGISGYCGGKVDKILMSVADIIMGMPQMVLLILLGAFLGANFFTLIIVLALLSWVMTARTVRARVMFIKSAYYVRYSETIGTSKVNIIRRHFIPQVKDIVLLSFIKVMSRSIVMEASLAYLGLSNPISKSWGMMLNRSMSFPGIYFTPYWKWWVMAPLTALLTLILSLMFLARDLETSHSIKGKRGLY